MAKKRIKRRKFDDNNYPVIRKYKVLIVALIVIFTIGLIFFVYNKQSIFRCNKIIDQSGNGYKVKTSYDIYSEKNMVTYVEIRETIYSDDINLLNQYKSVFERKYEEENSKYGGYTISTQDEKGKSIVKVKIDYSKININELKKEYDFIEKYIKGESITVEGVKKIYSKEDAKCE